MKLNNSLFTKEELPRRKRRVLMHLTDIGYSIYQLTCPKCGYVGDFPWEDDTKIQVHRNRPCPICNKEIKEK